MFRKAIYKVKKIIAGVLSFAIVFGICPVSVKAEESKAVQKMNIYGIYLEDSAKGDCVLLESEGEYLLMDIGQASHAPAIVFELYRLGIDHLSIYFSHLHKDHIGGGAISMLEGLDYIYNAGIGIDKLYLPDPSLAPESIAYPEKYEKLKDFMEDKGTIEYLCLGDKVRVGDAIGEVVGPVNVSSIHPSDYIKILSGTDEPIIDYDPYSESSYSQLSQAAYTYYENDCSLATIFTCGNTKFFTAGDCLAKEAASLVGRYGDKLDCDIMKLNHHGTGGGNTSELIAAISPTYSFASNTSYVGIDNETGLWYTYKSLTRAARWGMPYMVASEKTTIIYHVENDNITLYKGNTFDAGNEIKGWTTVIGGDGDDMKTATYYVGADGRLATGIKRIGGKNYNFGDHGTMVYGNFVDGDYAGWKTDGEGRRYYFMNPGKTKAYMAVGFATIKGNKYYFNDEGYRVSASEDDEVFDIAGKDYVIDEFGVILTKSLYDAEDGHTYYCNAKGAIVKRSAMVTTDEGEKYFLDNTGAVIKAEDSVDDVRYEGRTYTITKSGKILFNCRRKIDTDTYYFGKYGQVVKKKLLTFGKKTYYFGKTGAMVTAKKVRLGGKAYYFGKDGVMYKNRKVRINDVLFSCDENGVMKKVKPKKEKKDGK